MLHSAHCAGGPCPIRGASAFSMKQAESKPRAVAVCRPSSTRLSTTWPSLRRASRSSPECRAARGWPPPSPPCAPLRLRPLSALPPTPSRSHRRPRLLGCQGASHSGPAACRLPAWLFMLLASTYSHPECGCLLPITMALVCRSPSQSPIKKAPRSQGHYGASSAAAASAPQPAPLSRCGGLPAQIGPAAHLRCRACKPACRPLPHAL